MDALLEKIYYYSAISVKRLKIFWNNKEKLDINWNFQFLKNAKEIMMKRMWIITLKHMNHPWWNLCMFEQLFFFQNFQKQAT
jgi:hypothetical protein